MAKNKRTAQESPTSSGVVGETPGQTMPPATSIDEQAARLRKVICDLSETAPTSVAGLLAAYVPLVRKSGTEDRFPCTCHRHPINPRRRAKHGSRYDLLLFHIGDCLLTMYQDWRGGDKYGTVSDGKVLAHLEKIAAAGVGNMVVVGTDITGYSLR